VATVDQHRIEIEETRRHWQSKPLLREVYDGFYGEIHDQIDPRIPGLVVEIGSGMGVIKQRIPSCITTDLFLNPGIDRVESAYKLSFRDGEVGHLILFDVWHHLEFPGAALREFRRVVHPGGRVILLEPAMGLLGRIAFGWFHHEPLGLGDALRWEPPTGFDAASHGYYAAQGNAWRVFVRQEDEGQLAAWRVLKVKLLPALAYLASGGFRGPSLCPRWLFPLVLASDRLLSPMRRVLASRMLVVLEPREGEPR
jgi:SAM-dependent methyltransferase